MRIRNHTASRWATTARLLSAFLVAAAGVSQSHATEPPTPPASEGPPVAPSAPNPLAAVLGEPDPARRLTLQTALLALPPEAWRPLAARLDDPALPSDERRVLVWAIGERGEPDACGKLAATSLPADASEPDRLVRASAIASCGDLAPLREAFTRSTDLAVRLKAALLLGLHDDRSSLPAIAAMAETPEVAPHIDYLRLAMGLLGDTQWAPELRLMLNIAMVRPHAAIALARQGDASVAIDLRFALDNPEPLLRRAALGAMIDQRLPGTPRVLEALERDADPRIATIARRARRTWDRTGEVPRPPPSPRVR